ncbi:DUF5682 family protein [Nocardia sp. NPDC049707]|uniref:DUF5682 family protein n=1 Tax=Nocardia sp. NPDC049707 TaxID=3154735 RepID=UPI00341A5A6C
MPTGPVTFLGVRHHSPACARLVRDTIRALRPAHVLIEGPADMNDRLDELLLGHDLPIAIFTSYRDSATRHLSWTPLCDYSPEWVGLTEGRAIGAQVRFIDLPAWHPALADTENRYADAERRYDRAISRLCAEFGVDNFDTLWDHLFEVGDDATLPTRIDTYFDLVRGEDAAADSDHAREEYMSRWIRAALADVTWQAQRVGAAPAPVIVVTGGFHRPALVRRITALGDSFVPLASPVTADSRRQETEPTAETDWPEIPRFPDESVGGSYLVPYAFRRLDAFAGYQSGMPSPAYYHMLWHDGASVAADGITEAVVARLRGRGQAVSTADLIGARALTLGLSRLRGHIAPARTDVLDGLAGALITEALDRPLPWTGHGQLRPGTDPVVVEMVAALAGDTVGRLHELTPHPPLVADAERELLRCGIPESGRFTGDLTTAAGLDASRVLHRLRVLEIPGFERTSGPAAGRAPELTEMWRISSAELRLPALIEAGALGASCAEAAAARLGDRFTDSGADPAALAAILFDATLCGLSELADDIVGTIRTLIGSSSDTTALGRLLAAALGLWRHDRIFGTSASPTLGVLMDAVVIRLLWLVEGIRGGPVPADDGLLHALIAVRDVALHAESTVGVERVDLTGVFGRCTAADRPPALRGAAVGMVAVLEPERTTDLARAVRLAAAPIVLGDFLAGLFALAREQVLVDPAAAQGNQASSLIAVLDDLIARFTQPDFLAALPALRLAFAWFPPRERAAIANRLLGLRGVVGSAAALLRLPADPALVARAQAVELRVDELLGDHGLIAVAADTPASVSRALDGVPDAGDMRIPHGDRLHVGPPEQDSARESVQPHVEATGEYPATDDGSHPIVPQAAMTAGVSSASVEIASNTTPRMADRRSRPGRQGDQQTTESACTADHSGTATGHRAAGVDRASSYIPLDQGTTSRTRPPESGSSATSSGAAAIDPVLERWRLILGSAGAATSALSGQGAAQDAALDWLYERDDDMDRRDVRRTGGGGPSLVNAVDWLDDIHRLFPKTTIERLERDAVQRFGLHEVITDPGVLERLEPNAELLGAVLRTKHLMNPEVLRMARRIVERVVRELMAKLATEIRTSFAGTRSRRPSRLPRAADFDFPKTVRTNLAHYRPQERKLYVETAHFRARSRRHMDTWQVILLVDQSGSMAGSVIHSAVTAACLWGLPGIKTHLIAFDTAVVDLTADVDDPVELLMRVQLGGGTDIARAVAYAAQLVEHPRRSIIAVISDFYEGGDPAWLIRTAAALVAEGTIVLGLAALDEQADPAFDRDMGQRLADVGVHVGAMTPGELATFIAETIG